MSKKKSGKQINTRQKGARTAARAKALGEERGFLVYNVPHLRFQKDAFGVADAIWQKPGITMYVQYKTNQFRSTKELESFAMAQKVFVKVLCWFEKTKEWKERDFDGRSKASN